MTPTMLRVSLLALACLLARALANEDQIVTPKIANGLDMGFVFIQGANISTQQYLPTASAILDQAASVNYRLWIGLPHCPMDVAAVGLKQAISRVRGAMIEAGMPSTAPIFYGGHSLGGAMIQEVVDELSDPNTAGQILYGACLTRKYANVSYSYPTPTLAVGGEKDGLLRISRMAEAYHHSLKKGPDKFPVLVLPGVSHMQFASGAPPLLVQKRDLKPEVTEEDAHKAIAQVTVEFMRFLLEDVPVSSSFQEETKALVQPLIRSMEMEGSYHLQRPCNSDHPSPHCPFYPAWPLQDYREPSDDGECTCGSPWIQQRPMAIMGGLENVSYYVVDAFHNVKDINPFHHPHLWNNCSAQEIETSNCVLNLTTVTQLIYETGDELDTESTSCTAKEMRCKMKSRQVIYEGTIDPDAKIADTDSTSLCAEINTAAYEWALENAPEATVDRFKKLGIPMVMGKDIRYKVPAGPLWINTPLQYHMVGEDEEQVLQVRATTMVTDSELDLFDAAGYHFCKLLSPARAMEWIYVDGLRVRDSL